MRGLICIFVMCTALGAVSKARAQPDDPEALIAESLAMRRAGNLAEAIELLLRANELAPTGRTHAHLGFAYQEYGDWVRAFEHLEAASRDREHPWVQEHLAMIMESLELARANVGTIEVNCEVAGAELWIDGVQVGIIPLPAPVSVRTGTVVLEVRAAGYRGAVRNVIVQAGVLSRERIVLRPIEPENSGEADPAIDDDVTPVPRSRAPYWVLGTGTLTAGVSIPLYLRAIVQRDAFNADACLADGNSRGENCGGTRRRAERLRNASLGFLALGGATIATGVVWAIVDAVSSSGAERPVSVAACVPSFHYVGAQCEGHF